MTNNKDLNETGFFRLHQILKLIPIGKSTWWDGVKTGRFPKPIKLGSKTSVWPKPVIFKLIEDMSKEK